MRRFELREGTSSKFWEAAVEGATLVVRFGRIGAEGQTKRKDLASPAAAKAELAKLIGEKTDKGYAEIKRSAAAKASAKPAAAKSAPSSPGKFTFTSELDDLFERGYPRLFVLVEPARGGEKADAKLAKRAIEDIDPVLSAHVSRRAASRFLRGYIVGKTWRRLDSTGHAIHDKKLLTARDAELATDAEIDAAMLDRLLATECPHGDETYGWRVHEALLLFEQFLGVDLVAERIAAALLKALRDPASWGFWGEDPMRGNAHASTIALTLAGLRRRMPAARYRKIVAPFAGVASKKLVVFADLLACLADDARAPLCEAYGVDLAIARRDRAPLRAHFDEHGSFWDDPQYYFVAGVDLLERAPGSRLARLPKWWQRRFVEDFGAVQGPGVARLIAWVLSGRSAKKEAAAWLHEHEAHARPLLEAMARAGVDKAVVEGALAELDGKAAPAKRAPTAAQAAREVDRIMNGLQAQLVAAGGSPEAERRVLDDAYAKYCEVRAAAGEIIPTAYFTHSLPEFQADEATCTRWIDLAVDAANG